MEVILDTNALSAFSEADEAALKKIGGAEEVLLPVVVLAEFKFGILNSHKRRTYEAWLARGRAFWQILGISEETAGFYAQIRQELKLAGTPIPVNDTWIAALTRQHGMPLLSRDRHFDAVDGLERVEW